MYVDVEIMQAAYLIAGSPRFGESSAVLRRLLTLERCKVAPLGTGLSGGVVLLTAAPTLTPARTSSTFDAA